MGSWVLLILIVWSILRFKRQVMPWMCSDCRQPPLRSPLPHMELCKYRMWFLPPLVLLVVTIFFISQCQLPWSVKWLNISIGTDEFGAFTTCTKFFVFPELVELGSCLRPLFGKSYWSKKGNKTVKIWLCVTEMVSSVQTGTLQNYFISDSLATTVWIICNKYLILHDKICKYCTFTLSIFAVYRLFTNMHCFEFCL